MGAQADPIDSLIDAFDDGNIDYFYKNYHTFVGYEEKMVVILSLRNSTIDVEHMLRHIFKSVANPKSIIPLYVITYIMQQGKNIELYTYLSEMYTGINRNDGDKLSYWILYTMVTEDVHADSVDTYLEYLTGESELPDINKNEGEIIALAIRNTKLVEVLCDYYYDGIDCTISNYKFFEYAPTDSINTLLITRNCKPVFRYIRLFNDRRIYQLAFKHALCNCMNVFLIYPEFILLM